MWKTNLENLFIGEEDFLSAMDTTVVPLLENAKSEGFLISRDQVRLHYTMFLQDHPVASIVISHGFCEFIGKYHEMIYYFYKLGFNVFFMDYRGHGDSEGKLINDPDRVYVKNYSTYVEDLKQFVDEVVYNNEATGKLFLFAHSMGGGIGTLFLETYPKVFRAAVLSSPMMQMNYGKFSMRAVHILCALAKITGQSKKYVPGQHGFDNRNVFETSSALSQPRYEYVFKMRQNNKKFQTYGASFAWIHAGVKACAKMKNQVDQIQIPVLLCQAGKDSMVMPKAQEYIAEHSAMIELISFPESKHEIFNATQEIREEYYKRVIRFLEEQM